LIDDTWLLDEDGVSLQQKPSLFDQPSAATSSVLGHDRSFSKNSRQKHESPLPVSFAVPLLSQNAMSSIFMLSQLV
jgi:hypothetical protein